MAFSSHNHEGGAILFFFFKLLWLSQAIIMRGSHFILFFQTFMAFQSHAAQIINFLFPPKSWSWEKFKSLHCHVTRQNHHFFEKISKKWRFFRMASLEEGKLPLTLDFQRKKGSLRPLHLRLHTATVTFSKKFQKSDVYSERRALVGTENFPYLWSFRGKREVRDCCVFTCGGWRVES